MVCVVELCCLSVSILEPGRLISQIKIVFCDASDLTFSGFWGFGVLGSQSTPPTSSQAEKAHNTHKTTNTMSMNLGSSSKLDRGVKRASGGLERGVGEAWERLGRSLG